MLSRPHQLTYRINVEKIDTNQNLKFKIVGIPRARKRSRDREGRGGERDVERDRGADRSRDRSRDRSPRRDRSRSRERATDKDRTVPYVPRAHTFTQSQAAF